MSERAEKYKALEKPELISIVVEQQHEIEKLQNLINNTNKKTYGSKSERLSAEQIRFTFNVTAEPEQKALDSEIVVERHTRTIKRGRKPLPDDLPREEIVYEPEETQCACCKHELVAIGEERSTELEKIPAQLKVIGTSSTCPALRHLPIFH